MVVFRFIAIVLIVAGLMIVGYDVLNMLVGGTGGYTALSLDGLWNALHAASLGGFKAWAAASLPAPGPGLIETVLSWPAFLVTGVLGLVLALLFQSPGRFAD